MITCANCNNENPADAKFCQNCGHALQITCANCQALNDPDANFCKNCGQRFSPHSPKSTSQEDHQYLSEIGQSERRFITILFCDIVGSTAIGERLDPEEWTEIMNGVFGHLIPEIARYGGTTARLLGDAVLALFGAPIAHEDDPYRAVLAALAMLENFRPYREQVWNRLQEAGLALKSTDFNVRIGINTGLAIVGNVGSGEKQEYTAMGDAVNLAARMEQTAEPGTIQISHDTYVAVNSFMELEPRGAIEIKGKEDPVRAYRVLSLKPSTDRRQASVSMESPLVGRSREMKQLIDALSSLQQGRGEIICLIGEGGFGKSRLVAELEEQASDSDGTVTWYASESYSFESSQPYGLIQRLLRRVAGITQEDHQDYTEQKITRLFDELEPVKRTQPERVIKMLLGMKGDEGQSLLQGESVEREIWQGVRALVEAWSGNQPTVLVLEDLHWSDASSIELIKYLLPLAETTPLLLVCVYRPYRQSTAWMLKQQAERSFPHHYREIMLKPLSPVASQDLVGSLLDNRDLPQKVRKLIAEKTAGVPYFIEEIVSDLIERGALIRGENEQKWQAAANIEKLQVPDSLEAVLVSRMDRLDQEARRTLQLAAVIGRSFHYRVLKSMGSENERLDQPLSELQRAGMILETTRIPEPQYTFRHVLTQEAAYDTILFRDRRRYHRQAGEAIEELFSGQLDEQASLLAMHFDKAGEKIRALPHYMRAAENAAHLYANEEAMAHNERAIKLAGELSANEIVPVDGEPRSISALLGQVLESTGHLQMRLGNFDAARDYYLRGLSTLSDSRPFDQARFLLDIGHSWSSQYRYEESAITFHEAEAILDTVTDHGEKEWQQLWVDIKLGQADLSYWQHHWQEMSTICDKLKDSVIKHGTLHQQAHFYSILSMLSNSKLNYAVSEEALPYARQSLVIAEQIDDRVLIANKKFQVAFNLLWLGRLEECEELLRESLATMEEIGNVSQQNRVLTYLIITLRMMGDVTRIRPFLERAKVSTAAEGTPLYMGATEANLSWLAYRSGQSSEAEERALAALACWNDYFYPLQWLAYWPLMMMALEKGELETAVSFAAEMLTPDQQRFPAHIDDLLQAALDQYDRQSEQASVVDTLYKAAVLAKEHGYL